jgi:hypothetical protein
MLDFMERATVPNFFRAPFLISLCTLKGGPRISYDFDPCVLLALSSRSYISYFRAKITSRVIFVTYL